MRSALALLLLGALAGCKLVDQRSFGARPEAPAPDVLARALQPGPAVPLISIRFAGGAVAYDAQLRTAVQMAEARRPDAEYELATVVPATGTAADQVAAARAGAPDAVAASDAMIDVGVDPTRIHLTARSDPAATARELRVYIR